MFSLILMLINFAHSNDVLSQILSNPKFNERLQNSEQERMQILLTIVSEDGTLSPCNATNHPEKETDSFIRTGVHMIQGQKVHITTHEKMVVFDPRITRETFDVEEIFEKKNELFHN